MKLKIGPVKVSTAVKGRYEGFVYFIHRTSKKVTQPRTHDFFGALLEGD